MHKITYTIHPQYVSALFHTSKSFYGYFSKYEGSGNTVDKKRFK